MDFWPYSIYQLSVLYHFVWLLSKVNLKQKPNAYVSPRIWILQCWGSHMLCSALFCQYLTNEWMTVLAPNYFLSSWNAPWGFLNVSCAFVNKHFFTKDCWGGTESPQRLSDHLTVRLCKEKSLRAVSYQYPPSCFPVGISISSLWTPPSNLPRYFRVTFDTPTTHYLPLYWSQWGQTWKWA